MIYRLEDRVLFEAAAAVEAAYADEAQNQTDNAEQTEGAEQSEAESMRRQPAPARTTMRIPPPPPPARGRPVRHRTAPMPNNPATPN